MEQISITEHTSVKGYHTKMDGLLSISTSPHLNKFCKARLSSKQNTICKFCFADRYIKMRKRLRLNLEENYRILSERVYSNEELLKLLSRPLSTMMVRIEAFGDVDNINQVLNYLHIIKLYPEVRFAIWTKNHRLWKAAFDLDGKPSNCRYIVSSPIINTELDITKFEYADSVFTVFQKDTDESKINCGSRSCFACRKCYFGNEKYIREKLK